MRANGRWLFSKIETEKKVFTRSIPEYSRVYFYGSKCVEVLFSHQPVLQLSEQPTGCPANHFSSDTVSLWSHKSKCSVSQERPPPPASGAKYKIPTPGYPHSVQLVYKVGGSRNPSHQLRWFARRTLPTQKNALLIIRANYRGHFAVQGILPQNMAHCHLKLEFNKPAEAGRSRWPPSTFLSPLKAGDKSPRWQVPSRY